MAPLVAWLLMIARSRAIDHLRRRVPEPRDPASAVALADGHEEERADALLEQWRLAAALDRLPDDQADVLRRRFYLEQSQTEIAAGDRRAARHGQDADDRARCGAWRVLEEEQ